MKGAVHTSILLMELSTSGIRKEGAGSQRYDPKGSGIDGIFCRGMEKLVLNSKILEMPPQLYQIFQHYEVNILL